MISNNYVTPLASNNVPTNPNCVAANQENKPQFINDTCFINEEDIKYTMLCARTKQFLVEYPNLDTYQGTLDDNYEKSGTGVYTWHSDSSNYKGEWREDSMHGEGTFTDQEGNSYIGRWYEGMKYGKGSYKDANGNSYEGIWKNDDLILNCVKIKYSNGDNYRGQAALNYNDEYIKEGKGTYAVKNGSIYNGHWLNDAKHGSGSLTTNQGTKYIGTWSNDQLLTAKKVLIQYSNLDTYEGYVDEVTHKLGHGIYTWHADGKMYNGNWLDDKMHGPGTIIYKDGSSINALWEYGKIHISINNNSIT